MININWVYIRSNRELEYETNNDVLTITLDGIVEEFDFSNLPDGIAETIECEKLPANPIHSASKVNGEVYVILRWFYTREQKPLFEGGVDNV